MENNNSEREERWKTRMTRERREKDNDNDERGERKSTMTREEREKDDDNLRVERQR